MRVLILSCNTGEGHNSAGTALIEAFRVAGVDCTMKNALELLPRSVSRLISDGHVFVYRHFLRLFGWGYRFEERHDPKFLVTECAHAAEGMWKLIREDGCDAVICVHLLPALTMTEVRRQYAPDLPVYFVSTDYTAYPAIGATRMDAYFIPHALLADEYTSVGLPREKLVPTGIPVRAAFESSRPCRIVREELGLPADKRIVLLSCGSMGCGPLRKLAIGLKESIPADSMLVVICGSNERLFRRLSAQSAAGRLKVVGYTRRMGDYMDAADLFLTKAGGLSTTEAIVKRLPLVYIDAVPGCETHNLHFGLQNGLALTAEDVEGLIRITCECLRDPARLVAMSEKMRRMFPAHHAERICRYVTEAVQTKSSREERRDG